MTNDERELIKEAMIALFGLGYCQGQIDHREKKNMSDEQIYAFARDLINQRCPYLRIRG